MSTTTPKTTKKAAPKTTTAKKPTAAKSTTSKTTAPKTTTKTAKAASTTATAKPVVVDGPVPVISGPMMRKKELIELVVERSGIKKKDAKPVVEAMLAVLGEAIGDSRELNLHPMGKLKVRRVKQMPNGRVMVTKIRQSTQETPTVPVGLTPVPDAAE